MSISTQIPRKITNAECKLGSYQELHQNREILNPVDRGNPYYLETTSSMGEKVKAKDTQLYPTLCDPMDRTVHGILQARILEWVAFLSSRGSSQQFP